MRRAEIPRAPQLLQRWRLRRWALCVEVRVSVLSEACTLPPQGQALPATALHGMHMQYVRWVWACGAARVIENIRCLPLRGQNACHWERAGCGAPEPRRSHTGKCCETMMYGPAII